MLLKDWMGLKMENFNIMWVHWKIHFLGRWGGGAGGGSQEKQYIARGNYIKGGLRQFADLGEGAWQKRGQCTLCILLALTRLNFPTLHSLN